MDLRHDQKTIEELHKTSQKPVTEEQVRTLQMAVSQPVHHFLEYITDTSHRPRTCARRSELRSTSSALPRPTRAFARSSSTRHALRFSPGRRRRRSASSCKQLHTPVRREDEMGFHFDSHHHISTGSRHHGRWSQSDRLKTVESYPLHDLSACNSWQQAFGMGLAIGDF